MTESPAMKLAVNGRFLRGRPTGLHRVGRSLIDASRRTGLPLEVIAPSGTRDVRVDRTTWAPPGRAGEHLWEQFILPAVARPRPLLSLTNTAPLRYGENVMMVHDLAPYVNPAWFTRQGRLYGRLMLTAARRARGVLVPSDTVRGEMIAAGLDAERVFVVRNAIDEGIRAAPPADVAAARERFGLTGPYLLHLGTSVRKGVEVSVAAHRRLVADVPHELVVVGGTHPTLAGAQVTASQTIRLLGHVADPDLAALLTGASALVFPSRYEGFGLPPLEAAACGTPAICSDIPVLRECAPKGTHFVAPGDVDGWTAAMRDALAGGLGPAETPARTWDDAAADLAAALRALGRL